MLDSDTTRVGSETSVSKPSESYQEQQTYPAPKESDTAHGLQINNDVARIGIQRKARVLHSRITMTVNAGPSKTAVKIMRANKRLSEVRSDTD